MALFKLTDKPTSDVHAKWFGPMLERGTTFCAPNLDTNLAFVGDGQCELPLTFNDAQWDNSWICSPWTHYVSYASEEVARFNQGLAGKSAQHLLAALGKWLKRVEINRVVMVNNWLLSTVPWPMLPPGSARAVIRCLLERWPAHAIVFRSLHTRECPGLLSELESLGARLIPSRQIWWFPSDFHAARKSRDLRNDVKLLHNRDFEVVSGDSLTEKDFPALVELYNQLYLRKYSPHNPQYSSKWMHHAWQQGLMKVTALRDGAGTLVAMEGSVVVNGVLTSPVIGYDLTLHRDLGLYRRVAAIPIAEAMKRGLPLNLSAGVGKFKALRGGQATMEYIAVFDRHLPRKRQRPWGLIQWVSKHFLAPYVRKRQL